MIRSLFSYIATKAGRVYEALTLDEWSDRITRETRGAASSAGPLVGADQAMRIAAVYRCVRVLSESIASLPFLLYRRKGEDRELASEHHLFGLLHSAPNPEMTSMQVFELLLLYLLLKGNALHRKVRNGAGRVVEIWPIPWEGVTVERASPTAPLLYRVPPTYGMRQEVLRRDQVWHVAALSWDGITGMSPISYAKEAMGLALATEGHGSALFRNGARISGIVEHPGVIKDDEYDRYKASWDASYAGVTNAGKTAFLERGAKFQKVTLNNEEAQFLETRKFQLAEVCRIFGVPLHMVFDHDTQPRANMEQASLEFVVYSLRPWLERIEQSAARDLLDPAERAGLFPEFQVDGLLRGDFKTRMEGFRIGREGGWLSPNDICRLENRNPLPAGKGGDVYLRPSNMVPSSDQPATPAAGGPAPGPADPRPGPPAAPAPDPDPEDPPAPSARERTLMQAAAGRVARRELEAVRRAVKSTTPSASLEEFYRRHSDFVGEALAVDADAAGRYATRQLNGVLVAFAAGSETVDRMLAVWEQDLPVRILEEVGYAPVR